MTVRSKIPESTATNFQTILSANSTDRLCLVRVFDTLLAKDTTVICAINQIDKEFEFVPLAIMIEENPFERFEPPE